MFCHDSQKGRRNLSPRDRKESPFVLTRSQSFSNCETCSGAIYETPRAALGATISVQRTNQRPLSFVCRLYISRSSSPLLTSIFSVPAIGLPFSSASTHRAPRWLPVPDTKTSCFTFLPADGL